MLGTAADRLRRVGVKAESLLIATLGLSMLAQAALILRWPLPPLLPWMIICAAGAATVLSYAILSDYFPKAMSARANGALNVMNVGSAFVLLAAAGFIIELWPETNGAYPAAAHQAAMAVPLGLQLAALAWFAVPRRRTALTTHRALLGRRPPASLATSPYMTLFDTWSDQVRMAHRLAARWRMAAITSMLLSLAPGAVVVSGASQASAPGPREAAKPKRTPPCCSQLSTLADQPNTHAAC